MQNPTTITVTRRPRSRTVPVFAAAGLVLAGGYVLFERIGTTANVDVIEYYQRYAGGFVGVGRTRTQPGIVVLSLRDRSDVHIEAIGKENWATGRNTTIAISTDSGTWRRRLRGPMVVLIGADGGVTAVPVGWSREAFDQIARAVDCSTFEGHQGKACGRPFDELVQLFGTWPADGIPQEARAFLAAAGR